MKRLSLLAVLVVVGCYSGTRPGTTETDGGAADRVARGDVAPDAPAPYALCDGSARLRFRAAYVGGGQEVAGSTVRVQNGYQFLMVDGSCTYFLGGMWVEDDLSRDRPVLTGTLSAADATTLQSQLPLRQLAELSDCMGGGLADAGERIISVEDATVRCARTGARFEAAWATVAELTVGLRAKGRPMAGGLRIAAVESAPIPSASAALPYPWPLTIPLGSFLVELGPTNPTGGSYLVTDAANAAALRALRDRYLADRTATPGIYASWDGMRVVAGDKEALVFLRDVVPYEDERGGITF